MTGFSIRTLLLAAAISGLATSAFADDGHAVGAEARYGLRV